MSRVSVIVPSYNHAPFLEECLHSVVSQTLTDWEAIVIDDLSQDDSFQIARRFALADNRFQVFRNEANLGTYGTQARALELCQSEFVAVLNSDDRWESDKLAKQIVALDESPDASFCYCMGTVVDSSGQATGEDVHRDWPCEKHQDLFPFLLHENRILASGVVFRREFLAFEPSLRFSGDWAALLRVAFRAMCVCMSEPLTRWRIHGCNTFLASPRQVAEEIRVRRAILQNLDKIRSRPTDGGLVEAQLGLCAADLMALYLLSGEVSSARRLALWSLKNLRAGRVLLRRSVLTWAPSAWSKRRLWAGKFQNLEEFESVESRKRIQSLHSLDLRFH